MKFAIPLIFSVSLLTPTLLASEVRTWSDKSGNYTIEATLIAFNETQAVLERAGDKELGIVVIADLSEADREYLQSKEAVQTANSLTGALQKWTMRSGLQVNGHLVGYDRREVTLERRRGKIYVNSRVFENLPMIYQKIVPQLVAQLGEGESARRVTDPRTLESWLASLRGGPVTFTVDGVILELENGDEYGVPFFLFSSEDLRVLEPGWEAWLAKREDYEAQRQESFRLQAAAAAYQQDRQQQRQVAQMQVALQAVEAGITSVWEVTLYPGPGVIGPPLWVPVFARDSQAATLQALANNPGYRAGSVRRVSR